MYRVRQQIECNDNLLPEITGKIVGVGVLDTGISNHPDLQNRIVDFRDFVNKRSFAYK